MSSRAKTVHFRTEEVDRLVELIFKYRDIVECKTTNGQTWQEKETAWKKITEGFNSTNERLRTTESLKNKYEAMKKSIRKKDAKTRQEMLKTGGVRVDWPVYDPAEERVPALILLAAEELSNLNDKDGVDTVTIQDDSVKTRPTTQENEALPVNIDSYEAMEILEEEVLSTLKLTESPHLNSSKHMKSKKSPLSKLSNKRESEDSLIETKMNLYKLIQEDIEARRKREENIHELQIESMKLEILIKKEKLKVLQQYNFKKLK